MGLESNSVGFNEQEIHGGSSMQINGCRCEKVRVFHCGVEHHDRSKPVMAAELFLGKPSDEINGLTNCRQYLAALHRN